MKRAIDFAGAILTIAVLWPILLATAILVYHKLGRPILFKQVRPGLGGVPFELYKFRSMENSTDCNGNMLSDQERLTNFGKLLRKSSLDELPELINVIKGEMSLVGPRPLLMQYLERYSAEQARRHEVKPGITGWAQINGRNAISWQEKFNLDVWYVDNRNLMLDIRILLLTLKAVVKKKDINQQGHATAEEFMGNYGEE